MNPRLTRICRDAIERNGMKAVFLGTNLYMAVPIVKERVVGHQLVKIETLKQIYTEIGFRHGTERT